MSCLVYDFEAGARQVLTKAAPDRQLCVGQAIVGTPNQQGRLRRPARDAPTVQNDLEHVLDAAIFGLLKCPPHLFGHLCGILETVAERLRAVDVPTHMGKGA
jgi:hypothetical protein